VRDGTIAAVGPRDAVVAPSDARVLDCTGLTVTAGFWNSHVHLSSWRMLVGSRLFGELAAADLREMLTRYGFVHVVDTGSPLGIAVRPRERIAGGAFAGPAIRTTALGLAARGGSPFYLRPFRVPELATADQARAAVAARLAEGADGIEPFTGGLAAPDTVVVMDVALVRAVSEAAHARAAFVAAHPTNSAGARAALEGGADILAHTFPHGDEGLWDRSILAEMKQRGMALVPTLAVWRWDLAREGLPEEAIVRFTRVAEDQVEPRSAGRSCSGPTSATCRAWTRPTSTCTSRRRASPSRGSSEASPPPRRSASAPPRRPDGSRRSSTRTSSCSTAIPRSTRGHSHASATRSVRACSSSRATGRAGCQFQER
jgi:hypothetical protein